MATFENLEKTMCKELETLERKYQSGAEMAVADLDKIDKLAHALKSLSAYIAMKDHGYSERSNYPNDQNYAGYSGYPDYPGYPERLYSRPPAYHDRFRY